MGNELNRMNRGTNMEKYYSKMQINVRGSMLKWVKDKATKHICHIDQTVAVVVVASPHDKTTRHHRPLDTIGFM